jgi:hypothetical protein
VVGYQYLTTYSGSYQFTDKFRAAPNKPDGLDTTQQYEWVTLEYETIMVHPDHSFTSTLTRYILARGTERQVDVQGSGVPGGPFTSTRSCEIYSDPTPVEDTSGGAYIEPVLVKSNPQIVVGWSLPDYGDRPTNVAPPFHVIGTADCRGDYRSSFLDWSITDPGATVFANLTPTRKMIDAFGAQATIRYSKIRKQPWTRHFKNVTVQDKASRPGFTGPSTDDAKVIVNSSVKFERIYNTTLPDATPAERNKLVSLLISEGFFGLAAQGPAGGPPVGASGNPETVVVPGLGPGEISLDVNGTVVQNRSARAAAGSAVLLSSARARVTRGGRPVTLTIVPTAAGHQLLSGPHAAIDGRYVLGFRPRGSGRTYHAVEAFTIPATT